MLSKVIVVTGCASFFGKDDNGNVVDVADYKKLMDDIPNKIKNAMGITAEVNLHEEQGNHFIEIVTHPYSVPISLRGRIFLPQRQHKTGINGCILKCISVKEIGQDMG